jgi:16S rRNA (adenine1518-N6/adenine1519-N6)-dimethyltransferase
MSFNFTKIAKEQGNSLRLFGNLPYNISTAIIFHIFKHLDCVEDMHFMLQKEVAEVLVAQPGSSAYSRLSIMIQYHCSVRLMLKMFSDSFKPKPKVDSALVYLLPRRRSLPAVDSIPLLNCIVSKAFNQRRKKIRNSLNSLFSIADLDSLNINSDLRAQDITVSEYCKLTNWLSQHN